MKDRSYINEKHIMFNLITLFPVLNLLFNPLIYAVNIRCFRVSFIQFHSIQHKPSKEKTRLTKKVKLNKEMRHEPIMLIFGEKKIKCNLFTHGAPRSSQELVQKCLCIPGSNWKCWFLRRGENRSTRRKISRSREENQQQTQPTYDAGSGNRTRDTLVGSQRSHHCAIPAPLTIEKKYQEKVLQSRVPSHSQSTS